MSYHAPFLNELFAEFEGFPYGEHDDQVDTATPQGPRDVVLECWQTIWSVRVLSTLTGEGFKIIRSFGRDRRHRARNLCGNSSSARFGPCLAPRRRGNPQQSVDFVSVHVRCAALVIVACERSLGGHTVDAGCSPHA